MPLEAEEVKILIEEAVKAALMVTQQQQKTLFQEILQSATQPKSESASFQPLMDSLTKRIPKFEFDPETDQTFEKWLNRWKDTLDTEGQSLPSAMKKQLLITGKAGRP